MTTTAEHCKRARYLYISYSVLWVCGSWRLMYVRSLAGCSPPLEIYPNHAQNRNLKMIRKVPTLCVWSGFQLLCFAIFHWKQIHFLLLLKYFQNDTWTVHCVCRSVLLMQVIWKYVSNITFAIYVLLRSGCLCTYLELNELLMWQWIAVKILETQGSIPVCPCVWKFIAAWE